MIDTARLILFLLWVNLLPPLAQQILGKRFAWQVDGGLIFFDGQPLFGRHKTVRGLLASVVGGTAFFLVVALPWQVAALAALAAMAGDLLSSFIKRRLHKPVGASIFALDQIFEALLPLLVIHSYRPLFWWQFVVVLLVFVVLAYLGALFWQYLTRHPPPENYARIVRSTVRYREWRSCHEPLARWQTLLNLTSFLSDQVLLTAFFKITGLYSRGVTNALAFQLEKQDCLLAHLPAAFDGYRILLLTDLHLDGLPEVTSRIIDSLQGVDADLCLIGGDIRMKTYGPNAPCLRELRPLIAALRFRDGLFGVLGNHDCIEMTPDFEEAGITMLINDSEAIRRGSEAIWLVGVDDPHYYKTDDVAHAFRNVPDNASVVFLAHSPEVYEEAAAYGASLYLCGHTHGGQIRLPGSAALLTNSRAPRYTAAGSWRYGAMQGYTSRGVGVSGVPLRFNCPGEITLITLKRQAASVD